MSFYVRTDEDRFESTLCTRGPWDAGSQHAGPPAALLGRAVARRAREGYHTAMEVLFAKGSFLERGPAIAWMRMRVPLIEGEPIDPLSRVLVAADSGNGVSNLLDFSEHVFINADLTVNLVRYPSEEWVCLEARTLIDGDGIGLATSTLHDETGPIGHATQCLFVNLRS